MHGDENVLHHSISPSAHHISHNHALYLALSTNNPASFTPSNTTCRWCHRSKATASSGPPNHGNVGQCLRTTRCCRLDPASEFPTQQSCSRKTTVLNVTLFACDRHVGGHTSILQRVDLTFCAAILNPQSPLPPSPHQHQYQHHLHHHHHQHHHHHHHHLHIITIATTTAAKVPNVLRLHRNTRWG